MFLPLFIQISLNNQPEVQLTPWPFHACHKFSAFLAENKLSVTLQPLEVSKE